MTTASRPEDAAPAAPDSVLSWFAHSGAESQWAHSGLDEPGALRESERRGDGGGSAFMRLYRVFLAARAALGVALLLTQGLAAMLGAQTPRWVIPLSVLYALQALVLWWAPRLHRGVSSQSLSRLNSPRWLASIGFDLALFGLMHALDASSSANYSALYVMPVLMAGVLSPRLLAMATASLAALLVLAGTVLSVWALPDASLRLMQAGLVGSGYFVIGLLASEMASRLAREARAARGSMEFARQQAQLNRLVIEEMQEGVLVVDRQGRVRAANPAARRLLVAHGETRQPPFRLDGTAAWLPLMDVLEQAFVEGSWPAAGSDVTLVFEAEHQRSLHLRMRFTRRNDLAASEDLCVVFVEDNRDVQARLRQEKLAAMGRVSAGIAHEIRNPLAAIDQANALLAEDLQDPQQRRLTQMVGANVQRLKRIVDDVLEVAPGTAPDPVSIPLWSLVEECCRDWTRTNGLGLHHELVFDVPGQMQWVRFDPEHLRRILVNLLDNAWRHAERRPGAVRLRGAVNPAGWAEVVVFNAGAPIPVDVERHLFEPFFSTRSRGTGLGLYICRELCERYGARIDYRAVLDASPVGNEFVLSLHCEPQQAPSVLRSEP